jgi:hypothetical protein
MIFEIIIIVFILYLIYLIVSRPSYSPIVEKPCFDESEETVATGIAFGGGGTRSVTLYSAALAGVLLKHNEGLEEKMDLNTFINRYKVVGANSGGSWFTTMMIYSPMFYDMINSAGKSERDMFGGCRSIKPVLYLSPYCSRENMSDCGYGDTMKCCCDPGYKSNGDGECEMCDDGTHLTMFRLAERMVNETKALYDIHFENDITLTNSEFAEKFLRSNLDIDLYGRHS